MDEIDGHDVEKLRGQLLRQRDELRREGKMAAESRRPVELDQTRVGRLTRMDALQGQAMSIEAERRRQVEMRRIEAALVRIDDGEYGDCVRCGESIEEGRLKADPATPLCLACARLPSA
ncbi:MAG: TraR/DksA family transcriptional regulator, partial [Inquilinus sp.]|nr:TraR/DksA family transcriptional regulator [Inquilinus sp.]